MEMIVARPREGAQMRVGDGQCSPARKFMRVEVDELLHSANPGSDGDRSAIVCALREAGIRLGSDDVVVGAKVV